LKSFSHTKSAITPAGFLKFVNSVESLERLTLFGDFVDDACMERLGTMTGMKRFWTDSKGITSAGWVHLAGMTQMEELLLSKTNFGDEDARALEKMTKLHDLGLDGTKVTDKGMVALKDMSELQNLYVGMTDVTAKGLAMVPRKERMVMMRTGKERLTAKQMDELMQMYPGTQIFDPIGYWTPERAKAAMKELGKEMPVPKKMDADLGNGMKMELVLIPAGKFKMGSGESAKDTAAFVNKTYRKLFPPDLEEAVEAYFFQDEYPQHEVTITNPFSLGTCHVTRGQFRQFVAATAYKTDNEKDKKLLAWGWDSEKKQFSNDEKYSWRNTGFEQTDEHPVVNVTQEHAGRKLFRS